MRFSAWGLLALAALGCETTRSWDLPLPKSADSLFVVALGRPGAAFYLQVGLVQEALGNQETYWEGDSTMSLALWSGQDSLAAFICEQDGLFVLEGEELQSGRSYHLAGSSRLWGDFSSEPDTVPLPVRIDSVRVQFDSLDDKIALQVLLQDRPGLQWVGLSLIRYTADGKPLPEDEEHELYNLLAFPDTLLERMNGRQLFRVEMDARKYDGMGGSELVAKIEVRLLSFSRNTYHYLDSRAEQQAIYGEWYGQPVTVASNIKGAYGFWGVYNVDTITLEL
jgi:hypothetical protein